MRNNVNIPENAKKQVIDIINNSGVKANEFISEILNVLELKDRYYSERKLECCSYYDSILE